MKYLFAWRRFFNSLQHTRLRSSWGYTHTSVSKSWLWKLPVLPKLPLNRLEIWACLFKSVQNIFCTFMFAFSKTFGVVSCPRWSEQHLLLIQGVNKVQWQMWQWFNTIWWQGTLDSLVHREQHKSDVSGRPIESRGADCSCAEESRSAGSI